MRHACGRAARRVLPLLAVLLAGPARAGQAPAPAPAAEFTFFTCGESPVREIVEGRLSEAFRRLGHSFRVVLVPSCQRALMLANTDGDGDMARVPNIKALAPDDTTSLLQIPESVYTEEMVVFTKGRDFAVDGWASLAPYANGARIGSKIVEANLPGRKSLVTTTAQLFQMLDAGRIDAAVEFRVFGRRTIEELGLTGVGQLKPPLVSLEAFPLIHSRHVALVEPLARVLREMKGDGTFAAVETQVLGAAKAPAAAPAVPQR